MDQIITSGTDRTHMTDSKGRAVPVEMVSEVDQLIDQTVAKIAEFAEELSAQVARFKGHTYDDVNTTLELMAEKYGVKRGGQKGNVTLTSFDGCTKVEVQVADNIVFGPELQIAKQLVDEYIAEFSDGLPPEIEMLMNHGFQVNKVGTVNREALYSLRRLPIKHPIWDRAMEAIGDSMRVVGSKEYVRISRRENPRAGWKMIPISLSAV
ncbi:MAG: DUF3164 family protein [Paracoccus sp. (in: a-proteobacteria)]|uniref:DUF3164 family protein n=1 Tax=Paracoccus sp. TaxID=267 RepID=UPI0026E036B6|nr:DUF3164 family protein [Paracoccus sp. (in: a-proteobacteria)]MDO5631111.1 DUF3164 family protein [Paracoccus sp. (in: a-proteobacteria)]